MAKISLADKLALDAVRETPEQRLIVNLFREGKFFRAFNQSAWLMCEYVFNEAYRQSIKVQNPIAVTRNGSKKEGEYIMCGFPIHSIEKYRGGLEYQVLDEDQTIIKLPDNALDMDAEDYNKCYEEFAESIAKKHKKTEEQYQFGKSDADGHVHSLGMIDIIRNVNNYVIAEHTPMEVMMFVDEIQRDIHKLL